MTKSEKITCPNCGSADLALQLEATYVYSYELDADAPGRKNKDEFLSFLYDQRDQKETKQYVECRSCGFQVPCYFNMWDKKSSMEELKKLLLINKQ